MKDQITLEMVFHRLAVVRRNRCMGLGDGIGADSAKMWVKIIRSDGTFTFRRLTKSNFQIDDDGTVILDMGDI